MFENQKITQKYSNYLLKVKKFCWKLAKKSQNSTKIFQKFKTFYKIQELCQIMKILENPAKIHKKSQNFSKNPKFNKKVKIIEISNEKNLQKKGQQIGKNQKKIQHWAKNPDFFRKNLKFLQKLTKFQKFRRNLPKFTWKSLNFTKKSQIWQIRPENCENFYQIQEMSNINEKFGNLTWKFKKKQQNCELRKSKNLPKIVEIHPIQQKK